MIALKIVTDSVFLIVSECGNLVAKGTPRNRYICHLDEDDKKRFLTYSSKARADNAFEGSGFFLSDYTKQYIKDNYPELINSDWVFWKDIRNLFQSKEFKVSYESV